MLLDPDLIKDEVVSPYGYDQIVSHQVLDDHTLALHYQQPYSSFLATGQFDLAIFGNSYGLDNYGNLAVFHSKEIPNANHTDGGNWERLMGF